MRATGLILAAILLGGCASMDQKGVSDWLGFGGAMARSAGYGDQAETADGIRQALQLGSQRATSELSRQGAFDPGTPYHISLPEELQTVAGMLRTAGYGERVDQLETRMNRAAEEAVAEAEPVFRRTIRDMTVQDALGIVNGGPTAATDYFRQHSTMALRERFRPIIRENLEQTGFYRQYRGLLDIYDALPVTEKPDLDIETWVLNQSLGAVFSRLAEEERAIREAPLERGSELIQSVFGSKQG